MLRVLVLGSHRRHNLEAFVCRALEDSGHEVTFLGYRDQAGPVPAVVRMVLSRSRGLRNALVRTLLARFNRGVRETCAHLSPDLCLSIKGEAVDPEVLDWIQRETGTTTALWYPDDPRYFRSLMRHIAPRYDHVFTASPRAVGEYRSVGVERCHYLPFACDPHIHRPWEGELPRQGERPDVVFVGTYTPRRARILRRLERAGMLLEVYGPHWPLLKGGAQARPGVYGHALSKTFHRGRVVLNIHDPLDVPYKVNMRTFEATGCGAFLLTDCAHGLEDLFEPGRELVVYRDEQLVEEVRVWLAAPDRRDEVARAGRRRSHHEHTYRRRVADLLRTVT